MKDACRTLVAEMARHGVGTVLSALADEVRYDKRVRGTASLYNDLNRLAEEYPE